MDIERLITEFIGVDLVSNVARNIGGNVDKMAKTMEGAAVTTSGAWSKVGTVLKTGALLIAGVAISAGAALVGFATKAVASGDAAYELSARLGLTGHQASAWLSVLRQTGVDQDAFATSMKILSQHVLAGDQVFEHLGVRVKDVKGHFRGANDVLMDTIAALSKMPAGLERSALMSKLFGRSGQALTPLLDQGPVGISKMMAGGSTMTDQQVAAAHRLTLEWRHVTEEGAKVATAVGTALLPVLASVLGWLNSTGVPVVEKFAQVVGPKLTPLIQGVGNFLGMLGDIAKNVWRNLQPGVKELMPQFNRLMRDAGPIVQAVTRFLSEHHGQIQKVIEVIATLIGGTALKGLAIEFQVIDGIIRAVTATVGFIRSAIDGLVSVVKTAIGWVRGLGDALGKIHMPNIQLPAGVHIPGFAEGGFVPKDTLALVHAGEYVLPKDAVSAIRAQAPFTPQAVTSSTTTHNKRSLVIHNLNVNGASDPKATADAVWAKLAAQFA